MPTYVLKCQKGHINEVVQKIMDDPIEKCPTCKARCWRVPQTTYFNIYGFAPGRDIRRGPGRQ